jgi:uncharacterized Zn-binding protein involved in type VI secretion
MKPSIRTLLIALTVVACGDAAYAQAAAARQGDLTTHGGTVLTGTPTVIIGGSPAARAQDTASCPVVPAPPSPPHGGGTIVTGSSSVFIGGRPAARTGDLIAENGATSAIAVGAPTVRIGN